MPFTVVEVDELFAFGNVRFAKLEASPVKTVSASENALPDAALDVIEAVPEVWIYPVIPEIAPAEVISHEDELIATVLELFPKVVTPVEERPVNAPVPGVTRPIDVRLESPVEAIFQAVPPVIETPVAPTFPI